MNVIYFMVPIALLLAGGFVGAFIWATKNGQWDDLDLTALKAISDNQRNEEKHEQ